MRSEPETIIDEEIRALIEPSPAFRTVRGRSLLRRQRRRVGMLLHPERRMERILSGSLAEQLQGTPPTRKLRACITKKIIDLFWMTLPEEDDRWLQATNTAHSIAEAVMYELEQPIRLAQGLRPQVEEAASPSLEDEVH